MARRCRSRNRRIGKSQSFDPSDLFNPFLIIPVLVFGGLLRSLLGRLVGSATAGGLVALIAWFLVGSLLAALIAGAIASIFVLFGDSIASSELQGAGWTADRSGGGWSSGAVPAAAAGSAAVAAVSAAAARRGAGSDEWRFRRIGRHLLHHRWRLRRYLSAAGAGAIEQAIKAGEATHSGQVRFVVEGALDGAPLFRNQPARERALDIFSQLRIWDTAHNNGVLIYLLLADRDVEIVADRGIDARVGAAGWENICVEMESAFQGREFRRRRDQGSRGGVARNGGAFSEERRRTERTAGCAGGDLSSRCDCEERSDEAIYTVFRTWIASLRSQ